MRENVQNRQGLVDLVASLGEGGLIAVEIGSFAGESAEVFISTGLIDKIICIDPWEFSNHGDGNSYPNIKHAEIQFNARARAFGGKIIKFKGTIDDFIKSPLFDEYRGKIDFVYIDGLHTYDGCLHDIDVVISELKPALAISGHDYASDLPHVQGVKKAVNERFGAPDKTFCDSSWIKYNK